MRRVLPGGLHSPTPDEPDYDQVEQLYIDAEECIDCDACVETAVDAITSENMVPSGWQRYVEINAAYFESTLPAGGPANDVQELGRSRNRLTELAADGISAHPARSPQSRLTVVKHAAHAAEHREGQEKVEPPDGNQGSASVDGRRRTRPRPREGREDEQDQSPRSERGAAQRATTPQSQMRNRVVAQELPTG